MKKYDVAVIGSGLIGVSSAYELAKCGRKVALIDAGGLGAGASGANTGLLLFEGAKEGMVFDLCSKSIQMYKSMADELNENIGFSDISMLCYFKDKSEIPSAKETCDFYVKHGFQYDIIDEETLHKLEPSLNMDGKIGAMYFKQWGMDPLRVEYAYFARAREMGMDWYPQHKVTEFIQLGGKIIGVCTPQEQIYADQVVVATGAWTRELMQTLSIDIPEYYIHGSAMVAKRGHFGLNNVVCHYEATRIKMEKRAGLLAKEFGWGNFPRQDGGEFIVSQDSNGNLLTAQRSMVQAKMETILPTSWIRDMSANLLAHFPDFGDVQIIRSWIAPVPFVEDDKPFFGFVPPYDNLLLASGFASVLIMTPIIGKLACALLQGENIPYDLSGFNPLRFNKEV